MSDLPRLLCALLIGACPLFAQVGSAASGPGPQPRNVTYCDLSRDPAAYNHEVVRLTTFVTHGFEDFHLTDPTCATQGFSVWVMYGGKAQSDTAYCCPGESGKARPESLIVEGVQTSLVNDLTFQRFTGLLKKEPDTTVRLTAVGRFFAGEKRTINGSTSWGGFGHLGCCSLFVIQQVESFEAHTRSELDYTAEGGWYEKEGCKFRSLHDQLQVSIVSPDDSTQEAIAEQSRADRGEADWAFSDPERVAVESLKPLYPGQVPVLRIMKKTSARQVFRWKNGKKRVLVVVSRPYWLSFFAASGSMAWVTTMVKEAECD